MKRFTSKTVRRRWIEIRFTKFNQCFFLQTSQYTFGYNMCNYYVSWDKAQTGFPQKYICRRMWALICAFRNSNIGHSQVNILKPTIAQHFISWGGLGCIHDTIDRNEILYTKDNPCHYKFIKQLLIFNLRLMH